MDVELSERRGLALSQHMRGIVCMGWDSVNECPCVLSLSFFIFIECSFWLRLNRTEALSVTDKRQALSVKSTWHQASFSLADAESLTEAPAGG